MERSLTYEEKIRKAEEIYARRNKQQRGYNITTVNIRENRKNRTIKKVIIQMLVSVIIYGVFYMINTNKQQYAEDIKISTKQLLAYDIDLLKVYNDISTYFQGLLNNNEGEDIEQNENVLKDDTTNLENTSLNISIGENTFEEKEKTDELGETENLSQMEIDANQIKENYSLIKPLEGIISSEFGEREVTNSIITPEHYGIDIAADEGTEIIAALDGEVTTSTYSTSYRKFY